MKQFISFSFVLLILPALLFAQHITAKKQAVDYVNTLVGTPQKGDGGTLPSVSPPFAMTNFIAQTRQNKMNTMPYVYEDTTIIGFMATHQPTVWMGDYGYVSVMPQTGRLRVLPGQRRLSFSHLNERALPYRYEVAMQTADHRQIKAAIASTAHCGVMQFSYPAGTERRLIIQGTWIDPKMDDRHNKSDKRSKLRGYVVIDREKNEVRGYNPDRTAYNLGPALPNFKGYFVIRFNQPIRGSGIWRPDSITAGGKETYGTQIGAYVEFDPAVAKQVIVKTGTSFISMEQASANLSREIPGWDLEKVAQNTRENWQQQLSRISINTTSEDQKSIFYTAFYHTLLFPREMSEYGRYYSAFDDKVHPGLSYTDFSLWDTFRAQHPLLMFTQPGRVNSMIKSLLQMYRQGGWLPMWPNPAETNIMIATHADAVIADAFVKGFRGYDTRLAYEALLKDATIPPPNDTLRNGQNRAEWAGFEGRSGLTYDRRLGYVPSDKVTESVSRTLEYALDDYCAAQMARRLGKKDDEKRLLAWSRNYKKLYNPQTGMMAPRRLDGTWGGDEKTAFTEGGPWTYLFCVMQDIPGMIRMMGGAKTFAAKLDSNFVGGHYVHNNEPGHHYAYLYDYCDQPWKTQSLVRDILRENYHTGPWGLNGNDDCGQMSAWYIFSMMGFYPVTPASGMYAIGAPQCSRVILRFTIDGKPKILRVSALNFSEKNKYVSSVSWNGKKLTSALISHRLLSAGGQLTFIMTDKPGNTFK